MGSLVLQPGIEPGSLGIEAQSLNHWTTQGISMGHFDPYRSFYSLGTCGPSQELISPMHAASWVWKHMHLSLHHRDPVERGNLGKLLSLSKPQFSHLQNIWIQQNYRNTGRIK